MMQLQGKVVVVTGAGSGIGRALAQQFAAKGARLALSDVNAAGLEATLGMLPAGTEARGYKLDVSSKEAVFAHADEVRRDFGTVHVVVNNAGTSIVGTFEHLTVDEIEWQLGINLWGVIYGCKAFLPTMLAQREGVLVNISSVFGLLGFPLQSAYNVSKFGVRGLTECLWSELDGTGVRALCVHPGGIRTNIEKAARRCAASGEEEAVFEGLGNALLVTPPEDCAAAIIDGIERGKRRVVTGSWSTRFFLMSRFMPNSYPSLILAQVRKLKRLARRPA
jgi:NAD(P)-dependent dehydrogenase (short-subunit alcohol dehydrogenase family)